MNNTTTFKVRTFVSINKESPCCDTVWSRRWTSNQILQTNRTPPFTPVGNHLPNCKVSQRRTLIQTQQTTCRLKNYFCLTRISERPVIKMRLVEEGSKTTKVRLHQQESLVPLKSTSVRLKSKPKSVHRLESDDSVLLLHQGTGIRPDALQPVGLLRDPITCSRRSNFRRQRPPRHTT
jgi:hypothetical protein